MAFLNITEQGAVLRKKGQRLVVEKDENTLFDIPATKVKGVLIFGNVQVTTQALHLALQFEIELALFSYHGRLLGQLTPPATGNVALRQAQYACKADARFILTFSQAVVAAKAGNALAFLREFAHNHSETDVRENTSRLQAVLPQVKNSENLASLLGLEGTLAHIYFGAFAKMIRHTFSFDGRRKHPPPDPVDLPCFCGEGVKQFQLRRVLQMPAPNSQLSGGTSKPWWSAENGSNRDSSEAGRHGFDGPERLRSPTFPQARLWLPLIRTRPG